MPFALRPSSVPAYISLIDTYPRCFEEYTVVTQGASKQNIYFRF